MFERVLLGPVRSCHVTGMSIWTVSQTDYWFVEVELTLWRALEYFYSTGNYNVGGCQVHIYVGCVSINRSVCKGDTRDILNKLLFVCIIKCIPCCFLMKQHPFSQSRCYERLI